MAGERVRGFPADMRTRLLASTHETLINLDQYFVRNAAAREGVWPRVRSTLSELVELLEITSDERMNRFPDEIESAITTSINLVQKCMEIGGTRTMLARAEEKLSSAVRTLRTRTLNIDREVASRPEIDAAIASAVDRALGAREHIFKQSDALNSELRVALARLLEGEAKERKRSTEMTRELSDALSRAQSVEGDMRRAVIEAHDNMANLAEDFKNSLIQSKEDAAVLLAELQQYKIEAKDLLQVVGENGASTGYRNEAKQSKQYRLVWQILTVIFFCLWIVGTAMAFYWTIDKDLTWPLAARQFVVSLPFVLLTAFGAVQVSRANTADLSNQRAALEIHALGPLLAGLPDEDQVRIRGAIIPRFFGSDNPRSNAGPADAVQISSSEATTILGKVAEMIKGK